ncbi:MAG: VWA domain-containing protein [Acidobacteriota bacterium]
MKRLFPLIALTITLLAQQPTFRTETNLVIVNLSAKDKAGRPITNLKKEDVEILEDGVRQEIRIFEFQKLAGEPLAPVSFSETASPTLEERNAAASAGKAVVAPTANNPIRYRDRRLLCLFFDMTSMDPPQQLRAQEAAIKFLQSQMTSSDLVEIMTYSTAIKVVQEWTDNRPLLIEALRKLNLGEGSDLADSAATGADEGDDSGGFAADESEFNIFNTDRKLSALEDAARKLSVFPEKKALVYFSSGISKTGMENQSQIKATVNAAVRANVSFYPVDARGLVALPPGGDASTASARGTGMTTGSKQAGNRASFQDTQETLVTLASDTGGKAMLDTNDLSMGIRQAQEDIGSYYIIGYYSKNDAADGKFRRMKVNILDKSISAKLDYRTGYYAGKQFKNFNASDKERQLEEALTLGDPVSELPLALEVDYFRVAKERYSVPISVKIPGSAVGLTKKGAKQTVGFDFIGQVRDASGKLVGGVRDNITVKLNDSDAAQIGRRYLQYDSVLTLAPGIYELRFLARENLTGKMGTFETKFTIPDLSAAKSLRVSSVVLSSQKEPVSSAVGSADSNKKLLTAHPLVENGQKTVPSITRVFRGDQTLYVYGEVYDPALDPDRKTPAVQADFTLLTGGRTAFTSRPLRLNKLATSRPGVAQFAFQIPLAKLPPGQYISQVNVIDENGRKFAFLRNKIVLLAAGANTAVPANLK